MNRTDQAIEMYNKALQLNPDLFYSQADLVDLMLKEKRYDEAKNLIDEFISNIDA
ncbi:MAG: tetratricopeptide repeat protein [Spirochaetaceae bacterium]|nr:tetratricopeptide repeat protein [Spirochaetaceae bacterium]